MVAGTNAIESRRIANQLRGALRPGQGEFRGIPKVFSFSRSQND